MTLLVSGPMSRRELTEIADKQVRRAIQTVDGVGSVELNGGQARQIRVLLDAQKLTSHNFTVLDVREALQRENIEAPGGRMITGPQELGLRTLGTRHIRGSIRRNRGWHARRHAGSHPRCGASGGWRPGAAHMVGALSQGQLLGRMWSAIQVLRQSGANTVRVADDVRRQIDAIARAMPPGVQLWSSTTFRISSRLPSIRCSSI